LRLRERTGILSEKHYGDDLNAFLEVAGAHIPFVQEDEPLENALRQAISHIQKRTWQLYKEADTHD